MLRPDCGRSPAVWLRPDTSRPNSIFGPVFVKGINQVSRSWGEIAGLASWPHLLLLVHSSNSTSKSTFLKKNSDICANHVVFECAPAIRLRFGSLVWITVVSGSGAAL